VPDAVPVLLELALVVLALLDEESVVVVDPQAESTSMVDSRREPSAARRRGRRAGRIRAAQVVVMAAVHPSALGGRCSLPVSLL